MDQRHRDDLAQTPVDSSGQGAEDGAEPDFVATSDVPPNRALGVPEAGPTGGGTPTTEATQSAVGWIYPSNDRSRRSWPLVLGLIAVGVGVFAVVVILIFIGANVDPRDALARDFGERLLAAPEFRARFSDVDTMDEAYQAGLELGTTAYAHLDDPSLLRFWQLELKIWDGADDAVCAAVFRQTASAVQSSELLYQLDESELREVLDLTANAILAELRGAPAPPEPSQPEIDAAYGALRSAMGQQEMTDTATVMTDPSAEDAAVCEAAKSFVRSILELPDPDRAVMLRFMVSGE